jgi:hypothetical protein
MMMVSLGYAVVEVNGPDKVEILDLGSATGTYVNGERIRKHQLRTGDQIQLGRFMFVVTIVRPQAEPSPQPAAGVPSVVASAPAAPAMMFDEEERSDGRRALEVMVLWGRTVLDVRHLQGEGAYTIGDTAAASHFADGSLLPSDPFPLALVDDNLMVVNVPESASGQVMLDGKVFTVAELAAAGKLSQTQGTGSHSLRLPARARCRLEIGDLTFLVNSVAGAEAPLPVSFIERLDPQFLRYVLSAAVLHALVFLLVLSMPEDADRLSLDGFDLSDRFVEFILKPEEDRLELNDLFKDLQDELEAEKAKGDQGEMGDRTEKEKDKRFAVEGPQDKKDIELAREKAKKEAIETAQAAFNQLDGELSAVWGTQDRAIGNDAVSALGNMDGAKIGAANGMGGLGLSGIGRGGGGFGKSSIGTGGIGTAGRGRGKGGYGRGKSKLGERGGKVPKVIPGKPIISGGLDKEIIRRVVRRHRKETRYCYERELQRKTDLNGKIKVKFVISGTGAVILAQVVETTMNNRNVEACLETKIKRWKFPAPKGGGIVTVRYPFIFKAG